jgi:hypothetical protein
VRKKKDACFPCGHPLTLENSVILGRPGRSPSCRECHRVEMLEYQRRKRAAKMAAAWAYVPEQYRR